MSNAVAATVPDLSHSIADRITLVDDALVIPPPKDGQNRSVQKSGVLDAEGMHIENSITWRGPNQVTHAPDKPAEEEIEQLAGTWMFLGPLFGHFGHFLVESISRIWAYGALKDKIDGVLYVPKFQNRPEHVLSVYEPFLKALGVDTKVLNLSEPTRVERLYVPQQGFGMFQMIEGAPEFREFINAHAGADVEPQGAKKIYVSRSALPPIRGSIIGERILETWLEAEGYEIYHPQKHNHLEQIAAYKAATHIIAVDCSPLHLIALVGNDTQKIGIIARRAGDLDKIFAQQIRAFKGADAHAFNALERNWIENHANRPSRTSWGEVNFPKLHEGLLAAGLISNPDPWPALNDHQIGELVDQVAEGVGTPFKPFEN